MFINKHFKKYSFSQLFRFSILEDRELFFLYTFLLFVYLFVWSGFVAYSGNNFSLSSLIEIHTSLLVWLIDIAIILIPLLLIMGLNFNKLSNDKLKQELDTLKRINVDNIKLASIIGNGQFDNLSKAEDEMAMALIALGENLKLNKDKEEALRWITRGKEKVNDLLRSHNTLATLSIEVLRTVISYSNAIQGSLYILEGNVLKNIATFAYNRQRFDCNDISIGKGLVGQVAYEKEMIYRTEIPDNYYTISSGLLGERKPKSLIILPLLQEDELQGILEIAFLESKLPQFKINFFNELSLMVGRTIFNLKVSSQTERLLHESQQMTQILKQNEDTLRQNAEEMLEAQEELEKSNKLLGSQIQEVENAQKRLEALLTNASEFISIYDEERNLVFESPSVKRILGYEDEDDIIGMDVDMLTPRGFKTINTLFQYLIDTPGGEQTAQYTYLKKNGKKLFLETKGKNLLHDPAIKGLIFNTQDITERKRAEKEERMKSRMQSLSENSPDMIIRINTVGRIVYINPAVGRFIGVSANKLLKKRVVDLELDERFISFVSDSLEMIKNDLKQIVSEVELLSPDGERIMEIKAIPELSEEGELESLLFVAHDMTDIKQIEQEIKEKNKKISDSINYAQRIQTAILPDTKYIQQFFPRSFIFYRPKDIVSGDFPWFFKKDEYFYIAAVDCTGHGVPGALLSFIGYFLLNNIVNVDSSQTAAEILDDLHKGVRRTLRQDLEGANGRDGMDLALLKIDPKAQEMQFAGAHRPLYFLKNGELIEYGGTRKGIGGIPLRKKVEKDFENHVVKYEKGDKIFIFSDGLPDQLGGDNRKKYQPKRIREALTSNSDLTMAHFSKHFSQDFFDWMGEEKQVDDVLLIGIEL